MRPKPLLDVLSMSEKTWPNWNLNSLLYSHSKFNLSMSEKTWPNWNILCPDQNHGIKLHYPCLRRRGPIETPIRASKTHPSKPPIHVWEDVAQLKRNRRTLRRYNKCPYPFLRRSGPHNALQNRSHGKISGLDRELYFGEKKGPKLGVLKNNIYCRILIRCRMSH